MVLKNSCPQKFMSLKKHLLPNSLNILKIKINSKKPFCGIEKLYYAWYLFNKNWTKQQLSSEWRLSLSLILVLPPTILQILNNSYFLNFLKRWDCSWLLTIYLFLRNLKIICKSPYQHKSVDLKFLSARNWALLWEMFVHSLITCPRLKQTQSENNSLSLSSVFL